MMGRMSRLNFTVCATEEELQRKNARTEAADRKCIFGTILQQTVSGVNPLRYPDCPAVIIFFAQSRDEKETE